MGDIIALKSEVVLIDSLGEITAIVPQKEAVVVEVRRGPVGPIGPQGPQGPVGALSDGINTGDIIRYNAVTGDWESCAEPFEFRGIVLVPMTLPGAPVDGMVGFNIADNGLYVAVP